MKKIQISRGQFFVIMFLYVFSNDLIRGIYAKDLKRDTWVAVLIGLIGSILIFYIYSLIYKNTNDLNFTTAIKNILGRFFSKIIFIIYPLYFLLLAFFNIRDIYDSISTFLIQDANILIICSAIMILIFYIIHLGIETFSRMATIIFYFVIFIFVSFSILIFVFNESNFNYLFPILENGFKPVITPAFQMSYSIPFGELFALLIIYQYVKKKDKNYKFGIMGLALAGLVLLLITLYNIIIIGPEAMIMDIHPSLRITKRIDIRVFLQRFDLIVINVMLSLMIVKLTVLLFCAKHLFNKVIKIKKENIITFIIIIGLLIALIFVQRNYGMLLHYRESIIIRYVNVVFEIFIPFIIILISFIRRKKLLTIYS